MLLTQNEIMFLCLIGFQFLCILGVCIDIIKLNRKIGGCNNGKAPSL
jgi:hypothetical protein